MARLWEFVCEKCGADHMPGTQGGSCGYGPDGKPATDPRERCRGRIVARAWS